MEVSFDTEKRQDGSGAYKAPSTRIYAPTHKSASEKPLAVTMAAAEDTIVKPQPAVKKEETLPLPQKEGIPVVSRVLLILAIFLIAGTAILAINGNAKVAKIYTEIYDIENEITSYEEEISLLKKEQSSLNDYTTINEANQEVGRVMSWDTGE